MLLFAAVVTTIAAAAVAEVIANDRVEREHSSTATYSLHRSCYFIVQANANLWNISFYYWCTAFFCSYHNLSNAWMWNVYGIASTT